MATGDAASLQAESAPGESLWAGPLLVSPGGRGAEGSVGTGCPTFSWGLIPAASGYEVTVYAVGTSGEMTQPAGLPELRAEFPAGVTSWTPELSECLEPGRYAWVVAAFHGGSADQRTLSFSKPAVFRVEGLPLCRDDGARPPRSVQAIAQGGIPVGPPRAPPASSQTLQSPRNITSAATFTPPDCSAGGETFDDVPASDPFCRWVEQLARDLITQGCGVNAFCPDQPVTRKQIAMLLEKAMRGTLTWAPSPPAATDVTTVDDQPATTTVGRFNAIAIGADELPIIGYHADFLSEDSLKVAHCDDAACAPGGETITTLVHPFEAGSFVDIAIGTDGLPIISHRLPASGSLEVTHCDDVACAPGGEFSISFDSGVGYSAITIGADGFPIVSYSKGLAGTLNVLHCNDVACAPAGEMITTVDDPVNGNNVGQHNSIAIGADGLPIIAYQDFTDGDLKVVHCDDVACAPGGETITTVHASANVVGVDISIAIGTDGLPIISYHDSTANTLLVVHCNDDFCSGQNETVTTVDDPTNGNWVGAGTSIAIGVDGMPIISYLDLTAESLKVAHCHDLGCVGSKSITTVDNPPVNAIDLRTSIAIGIDGMPIISYHDATAGSLKVAHCETVSCGP